MPPRKQSEEVVPAESALPALANTPALDIGQEDIQLPKLYVAQSNSGAFTAELVPLGSIFLATGGDDPDPQVLYSPKEGGDGVLFHVLDLIKGWSYSEPGSELERWAYDDESRHPDAWVTYTYVVLLPEVDPDVPAKVLLTRTNAPTAKRINTLLVRNAGQPPWTLAFRLKTQPRENKKGKWHVVTARQVDAKPANVEQAAALYQQIQGVSIERTAGPSSEPAI